MNAIAEALLKSSATTSDPAIARHVERLSQEMAALRAALERATLNKMVRDAAGRGVELTAEEIRTTMKFDPTGPTAQRFSEVYSDLLRYAMASRRKH